MSQELKTMLTASVNGNPLEEISPHSLDELFQRINDKLAMGLPEAIEETDIEKMVDIFTLRSAQFLAEQSAKNAQEPRKRASKAKPQNLSEALDLL